MTSTVTRDRSHLQLVVSDICSSSNASFGNAVSAKPARSTETVPSERRSFSPVRLARTAESSECADSLADAYHRERLITPFRSVLRVEVGELMDRKVLALAIEELESRGWTVSSAILDEDLSTARALWLRPYA